MDKETEMFHSPKRGVMSATRTYEMCLGAVQFHSPKRGVMSATTSTSMACDTWSFIPLNGASCLQPNENEEGTGGTVSFP